MPIISHIEYRKGSFPGKTAMERTEKRRWLMDLGKEGFEVKLRDAFRFVSSIGLSAILVASLSPLVSNAGSMNPPPRTVESRCRRVAS